MLKIVLDILAAFGDSKTHLKEEVYEVIRNSLPYRMTVREIDNQVKKLLEYNLLKKVESSQFKGYEELQITEKGIKALDYYRDSSGHRKLEYGELKNPIVG